MDDIRFGAVVRLARQSKRWRQEDLAARAGLSQSAISRIERGHIGPQSVGSVRKVCGPLEIRVELVARWRGGDLDRLMNRRHSALHESVARRFREDLPAWILAPEVSFSIYGERGVIDILAWHPGRRALLVIELKTEIVDVNELIGTFDRKRRLAARIARERDWDPAVHLGLARDQRHSNEPAARRSARSDAARGAVRRRGHAATVAPRSGRTDHCIDLLDADEGRRCGPIDAAGTTGAGGAVIPGGRYENESDGRFARIRPRPGAASRGGPGFGRRR